MIVQRLDELLLDVYGCAADGEGWSNVLDQVCRATRSRSAIVQILATDTERVSSHLTLRDSASEAARDEHERLMGDAVNPRMRTNLHRRLPPGDPVHRDDHFFAQDDRARAELRERLAELRLGHFMSVGLPLSARQRIVLVLHRDLADRHDFGSDEQTFALRLVPHLRQSLQSCLRAEAERERAGTLERAVDRLRCAFVLAAPDGHVHWANRAAHAILCRRDRLWIHAGQLRTPWPHETSNLRSLIARVAAEDGRRDTPAEHFFVVGRNDRELSLQIMMQPFIGEAGPTLDGTAHRSVMLILSEPCNPPDLPAESLEELFGLSPAEARLASALCGGITLREYARKRGVTVGTVRFQLRQVLAKTGARRQGNLIQQLCSSVIAQGVLLKGS